MLKRKYRGFKLVESKFRKHLYNDFIKLPERKTNGAAAYDFYSNENITIYPGEKHHFWTDVKAYMRRNEVLILNVRSSIGFKKNLMLVNTQGWIDSDYYSNPENDGNIGICLYNFGSKAQFIKKGERIAQGMFIQYLKIDNDSQQKKKIRKGGIGSTGK